MAIDLLLTLGGLALLVVTGDMLVRGAVALSLRLGVPALIVSATVVAFGTSAPELLISVEAALAGLPGIALGNVVGTNIANVWLVLGVPALLAPIGGCTDGARRSLWFMLAATAAFTALIATGTLVWWGGLALLAIVVVMVADSLHVGLRHRAAANGGALALAEGPADGGGPGLPDALDELEDADPDMPGWKIAALIAAGVVGLPLGADLLIDGASGIAMALGVSEAAIGLTLVAFGTSLPELATTVMAAIRNRADVAIGNVLGSNLFNLPAVIGAGDAGTEMTSTTTPRRRALVTGAGVRLGRTMALHLAARGWDVAVHYATSAAEAEETAAAARASGAAAVALGADLLDWDETAGLVARAGAALGGPLALLVNNASIFEPETLSSMTRHSWERAVDTNLRAPVKLTQDFAGQAPRPSLDAAGEPVAQGFVVNMLDQRVWKPTPYFASYTLAKSALLTFTRTAAQALAPGVRVNAIGPGPTLQGTRQSAEHFRAQRAGCVLKRGADPEDILATLDYILACKALTGQMIAVDGGQHLAWQTPDVVRARE